MQSYGKILKAEFIYQWEQEQRRISIIYLSRKTPSCSFFKNQIFTNMGQKKKKEVSPLNGPDGL